MTAGERRAPNVVGIAVLAVGATLPVSLLSSVGIGFGLPVEVLLPTLIAVSVWGAVSATSRREPGLRQLATRVVGYLMIGVGVRLLAAVIDGTTAELTGSNLLFAPRVAGAVFVVIVVFALAHGLARRALLLTDAGTSIQQGAAARGLLGMVLGIVLGVLTVHALPAVRTGLIADAVMVGAAVATFVALAGLRARAPAAGGTRAAVVERPRAVVDRAVLLGMALVALVALALVPLASAVSLPDAGPAIGWLADRDWFEFDAEEPQPLEGQGSGRPPEREVTPRTPVGDGGAPTAFDREVPLWLGLLIAGGVIVVVLRPDRLVELWRALRVRVAAGRRDEGDAVALDAATPRDAAGRLRGSGRRGLLDRLRPRPREPRAAVLHDYARLERLLARRGYGRAGGETPIAHARRIRADQDLEAFVVLVSEARWSAHELGASDAADSRRLLAAVVGRLDESEPGPSEPESSPGSSGHRSRESGPT